MYKIRPMTTEDALQVSEMEKKYFSEPWSKQAFLDALGQNSYTYVVAEDGAEVIGYAGMYRVLEEGNITQVAVREDKRRTGVAGDLMRGLMRFGDELGVSAYTLEVRVSNAGAICLYESCGFEKESIRKNFYASPAEDAYIMWKR
nr:ribosomal protein S18-alanine N-acetyltransferase [Lachnospiraceae bacterium]